MKAPWPEGESPTGEQWQAWFLALDSVQQRRVAETVVRISSDASRCFLMDHERELRRARFHERGNFQRWQDAQAVIDRLGIRDWEPGDGDTRCQDCGMGYEPWFTDDAVWNRVIGAEGNLRGEGVCLCARCFTSRARRSSLVVWLIEPQEAK